MWAQILSRIIEFLFGTAGAGVILWLALPRLVNNLIDHQFSKKLEDHKHHLQQITSAETHNYQRLIKDFDLFTTKRHEVYAELFRVVLIADGHIRGLIGGKYSRTFEDYGYDDIEKYLKNENVPEAQITHFLTLWKIDDKEKAIVEIKKYIRRLDIQLAQTKLGEAQNYYYQHAIYLSDDVSKAVEKALGLLIEFWVNVETPEGSKYFREDHNRPIDDALSDIREVIRRELAVGYYTEDEIPKPVPPRAE